MKNLSFAILFIVLAGILIASQTLYVVKETERAVVLKFGEIVEADTPEELTKKVYEFIEENPLF